MMLQRDGRTSSLALGDPLFTQPAQNGDVVTVPEAPRVNVVGMVDNARSRFAKDRSSLLSAVYTAGGPVKFADLRDVQIIHGGAKKSYNITALTHGDMSQNPVLQTATRSWFRGITDRLHAHSTIFSAASSPASPTSCRS